MESLTSLEITCFNSIEKFYTTLSKNIPDIIFLDLSMPSYVEKDIEDGFHLAKILRSKFPEVKIIISTMHTLPLYIFDVIERVKPEAFLIKSDADASEICRSFEAVVFNKKYFSKTAKQVLATVNQYDFCKDEINRNILLMTAKRYTTDEISEKLLISTSTVEKRKAGIKHILNLQGQNDKTLVQNLTNLNLL